MKTARNPLRRKLRSRDGSRRRRLRPASTSDVFLFGGLGEGFGAVAQQGFGAVLQEMPRRFGHVLLHGATRLGRGLRPPLGRRRRRLFAGLRRGALGAPRAPRAPRALRRRVRATAARAAGLRAAGLKVQRQVLRQGHASLKTPHATGRLPHLLGVTHQRPQLLATNMDPAKQTRPTSNIKARKRWEKWLSGPPNRHVQPNSGQDHPKPPLQRCFPPQRDGPRTRTMHLRQAP